MDIVVIILLALTVYYCLSIFYLFLGLFRLPPCNNNEKKYHFITVIIAAHNEEKHLAECLQCIAGQDYPKEKYEVIVADDRSTDNTPRIIGISNPYVLISPKSIYPRRQHSSMGWILLKVRL